MNDAVNRLQAKLKARTHFYERVTANLIRERDGLKTTMEGHRAFYEQKFEGLTRERDEARAHCVRLGQGGAERYWEARWRDEAAIVQVLAAALAGIRWKSADKDNMEFSAVITYHQMDAIRAALDESTEPKP